jgi:hypothetical protein
VPASQFDWAAVRIRDSNVKKADAHDPPSRQKALQYQYPSYGMALANAIVVNLANERLLGCPGSAFFISLAAGGWRLAAGGWRLAAGGW